MKPWEQYQPKAESQGPWEQYGQAPTDDVVTETPTPIEEPSVGSKVRDYLMSGITGASSLLPAIAGLPVDTARNLANLGIAGYGAVKGELGGTDLPEPLEPSVGGSEWIKQKYIEQAGVDPFTPPDPTDPTQQNIHIGASILAGGALAPGSIPANIAKMAPSAAGAVIGKEAFPDQPLAPIIGALASPAAIAGAQNIPRGVARLKTKPVDKFIKAHRLGYKVPPSLAKPSMGQQAAEGAAGPVPVKQRASIYNQKVTNDLIKKDIGYPKDTPLSRDGLGAVRAEAGKVYEQVKGLGNIKTDAKYIKELNSIASKGSAISKEFPGLVKKDVADIAKVFNKKNISAEAAVDAIKQLRADSSAGFRSADPAILAVAKAKGRIAGALEKMVERSASTTNPDLVPALRNARQRIAKTYGVEKALKGDDVDAVSLGRELNKGKPMSGLMRDVAEFGQNFKGAAQVSPPQQTGFRGMDLASGVIPAIAYGDVTWLAAMGARPALRTLILSKPYQARLAKIRPTEMKQIAQLPKEAQAAAIASLLDDLQTPLPDSSQ